MVMVIYRKEFCVGGMQMQYTNQEKELSLDELISLTRGFIELADQLYTKGKLSKEEYEELTYIKKDFLIKAETDQEDLMKTWM